MSRGIQPFKKSNAEAVQKTFQSSTVVSGLTGNPVTATTNTALVSLLQLLQCRFSLLEQLDSSESPIAFSLGAEEYMRGAVVMALIWIVGLSVLLLLVAAAVPGVSVGAVLGVLRMPSLVLIPVAIFHQGMVTSAVSLARLHRSSGDVVLAVAGLGVGLFSVAAALLCGTLWNRCRIADRAEQAVSRWAIVRQFLAAAIWTRHWVEPSASLEDQDQPSLAQQRIERGAGAGVICGASLQHVALCKPHLFFLLSDARAPWWTAVELAYLLVQGVVIGLRDPEWCTTQAVLLAVLACLMLLLTCLARPVGSQMGGLFLAVSKLGAAAVAVLVAIHSATRDGQTADAAETVAFVFGVAAAIQSGLQLLLLVRSLYMKLPGALLTGARIFLKGRDAGAPPVPVNVGALVRDTSAGDFSSIFCDSLSTAELRSLEPASPSDDSQSEREEASATAVSNAGQEDSVAPPPAALLEEERTRAQMPSGADDRYAAHLRETTLADASESMLFMPLPSDRRLSGPTQPCYLTDDDLL
jgi:hypothetical protein